MKVFETFGIFFEFEFGIAIYHSLRFATEVFLAGLYHPVILKKMFIF
jgi:hypothetical protein